MNDAQLKRCLKSIGKECFVTFFDDFNNADLSADTVANRIADVRNVQFNRALSRVSSARRIIANRRGKDALVNCSRSKFTSHTRVEMQALSKKLLKKYYG